MKNSVKLILSFRILNISFLYCSGEYLKKISISGFKGPLLGLRQFVTTESSLNMMENAFYLIVKSFFAFLRYFHFCPDFLVMLRLITKFMTS